MTVSLAPSFRPQFFLDDGTVAAGAQVFFYIAGTSTKQNTFSDAAGAVANPNPIVLDSSGRPDNSGTEISIFLTDGVTYDIVIAPSTDTDPPVSAYRTIEDITGLDDLAAALADTTSAANGDALIGEKRTDTGSTARTRHLNLEAEVLNVMAFMTSAEQADVKANSEAVDVTTAIQTALDTGYNIFFPRGTYKITAALTSSNTGQRIFGEGYLSVIHQAGATAEVFTFSTCNYIEVDHLRLKGNQDGANGVSFTTCDKVMFHNNWVTNFGTTASGISGVFTSSCDYVNITDNVFESNDGTSSGDINVNYTTTYSIVKGNFCLSNTSDGIVVASVDAGTGTDNHIITNNVVVNKQRYGIIGSYGQESQAIISNNIIYQTEWEGIYVTTTGTGGSGTDSKVIINGNQCIYTAYDASGSVTGAGIYVSGNTGFIVTDNYIENTGYTIADVASAYTVYGIYFEIEGRYGQCSNNIVKKVDGYGIGLHFKGTANGQSIISDNIVTNTSSELLYITVDGATAIVKDLHIDNNIFEAVDTDIDGIDIRAINSGTDINNLRVTNNTIIGLKATSAKEAFYINMATTGGCFKGNTIRNWDEGINWADTATAHLHVADNFVFEGNNFDTVGTVWSISVTGSGYALVLNNNYNTTTTFSAGGNVADAIALGTRKIFWDSAAPTTNAWIIGDTVFDESPASAAPQGWACTAAGTPGTWTALANLA